MLHDAAVSDPVLAGLFAGERWIDAMLTFERALAEVEGEAGVIPGEAARAVAEGCRTARLDPAAIVEAAQRDGNPVIPFVRSVTAALPDGPARAYVHWGATSQDVLDTALMLLVRDALDVLERRLGTLGDRLANLAETHADTVMAGRTLLQHALPVTFGLKAAVWLDPFIRHRERLAECRRRCLVVQLGGAAGTLAALDGGGAPVVAALARRLGLGMPDLPWHGSRDRIAEIAFLAAALVGSCAKMARDVTLLMQTEVGEAHEKGAGGSSTLPHKRNPVRSLTPLAAQRLAGPLLSAAVAAQDVEHERAAGAWHGEWPVLPRLLELAGAALRTAIEVLDDLVVDPERMRANLDMTLGLIFSERLTFALAPALGRADAKAVVERLCREAVDHRSHLRDLAERDGAVTAHLDPAAIAAVFDPANALGDTAQFIDATVARWRA